MCIMIGALGLFGRPVQAQIATYDTVSIHDIQFVNDPATSDTSSLDGDTVVVKGIVIEGPRSVYAGAAWTFYISDETGGPWSGIQVIQHDTVGAAAQTGVTALQANDLAYFTGVIEEYGGPNGPLGQTEIALLTDPPVPVIVVGSNVPLPEPEVVDGSEMDINHPNLSEKWESVIVKMTETTVLNPSLASNQMLVADADGDQVIVDDNFDDMYDALTENGGEWPFPPGSILSITGLVRGYNSSNGTYAYTLNPRNLSDVHAEVFGPLISRPTRDPLTPSPYEDPYVEVSAKMYDIDGQINSATLYYAVDNGAYQAVSMTVSNDNDSVFVGQIPVQAEGAVVQYFVVGEDNTGNTGMAPADTSLYRYFFKYTDSALDIKMLQWSPFKTANSSYMNYEVTVTGTVTTDTTHFGYYYIQDGNGPWSGIKVLDYDNNLSLGTRVRVTGTVDEYYNETRLDNITNVEVLSENNPVPDYTVVNTGDVSSSNPVSAEQYEGVLVEVDDVTVTDSLPDAPDNYGEFAIDDGTGEVRVDDAGNFAGNYDSTRYHNGDQIATLRGVLDFNFNDFKIIPRDLNDVIGHIPVATEPEVNIPDQIALAQNYPNPFNPSTRIQYSVPRQTTVTLRVYDLQGKLVRELVSAHQQPGTYQITWDGKNQSGHLAASGMYFYRLDAGTRVLTHKMLLIR